MKRAFLLISVVHLLLAFFSSCTSVTTTLNQVLPVVHDINGEIVRSDARYFVVSAIFGARGGGVTRGPTLYEAGDTNFVCPSQVVQSPIFVDKGTPVYFKPKAPEQAEITESTDLNIVFYLDKYPTICNNTVWEVEGFPGPETPKFLSTNGEAGNPLKVSSWFRIKTVIGHAYKLVFCPFGEDFCNDIGIKSVDGQWRLAIGTDQPFIVMFVKDSNIGINSII